MDQYDKNMSLSDISPKKLMTRGGLCRLNLYGEPQRFSIDKCATETWLRGSQIKHLKRDNHALLHITHGHGDLRFEQEPIIKLKTGMWFLLSPQRAHHFTVRSPSLQLTRVACSGNQVPTWLASRLHAQDGCWETDAMTRAQWYSITQLIQADHEIGAMVYHHLELLFLYTTKELFSPNEQTTSTEPRPANEQKLKIQLQRQLQLHFLKPKAISNAALACHISPEHFSRTYKKLWSLSPQETIDQWKSRLAQDDLKEGHPLKVIAQRLNFADAYSFSKAFKRWTGMSPRAWRRELSSSPCSMHPTENISSPR